MPDVVHVKFEPDSEEKGNSVVALTFNRGVSFADFKTAFLDATNYTSATFGTPDSIVDDDKSLFKRLGKSANVILRYSTG